MPRKAKSTTPAVEEKPIVVEVAPPAVPVAAEAAKPAKKKRVAGPEAKERMLHASALIKEGKSKSEALKAAWAKYPSKKIQAS